MDTSHPSDAQESVQSARHQERSRGEKTRQCEQSSGNSMQMKMGSAEGLRGNVFERSARNND
jgi:hypothetical protein